MAVYVILDIVVHNPEAYEEYKTKVVPIIQKYGGRYLVRGGAHQVIEGDWHPTRLAVLEFPSMEAAQQFASAPEYQPVKAIREANATSHTVVVEGV